jgi:hypothetical protein
VTIETITVGDFEAGGHHRKTEGIAVLKLQPMEGLKFPCRWNHHGPASQCNGVAVLQGLTRKNGFRISGRCTDGTVRVFRYK